MRYLKSFRTVSILMYFLSLFLPIFSGSDYIGLGAFIYGIIYLDVWDSNFALPWLSNILYFFNLITYKRWTIPGVSISILTILMASFALGIKEVLINEGGATESVSVGIGYWFWVGSFIILFSVQFDNFKKKCKKRWRNK